MKMDIHTDENRFHALKFAAQTLGNAHPGEVVQAANLYLDFLEGRLATTQEQAEAEAKPFYGKGLAEMVSETAVMKAAIEAMKAPLVTDEKIDAVESDPDLAFVQWDEQIEAVDDASFADAGDELFEEPDALTAKIQSAIVEIAPSPPAHPDETDAPEMTDEQVETLVLERMEAQPPMEPTVDAYINPAPHKKLFPWAT
jgi:hypothetical protein